MIVTGIQELTKAKVKVSIDYEFAFVLYKGELRTYGIKEEAEITQETYRMIVDEVLTKRAKLRCMYLLKRRDYTKNELIEKLRKEFYTEDVIECAIAYVISFGYVDDLRYAKTYINYASKTKSRKQIEFDLVKKGISKEDITASWEELSELDDLESEEKLIQMLLVKKHYKKEEATMEERRKMIGFLYRKGFSLDKIYKVVSERE